MIWKVLGLFGKPLTSDDKYPLLNRGNLLEHLQMELSQKKKLFGILFLHFRNLDSIFNIFKKNMTLIVALFLYLGTPKNVVT